MLLMGIVMWPFAAGVLLCGCGAKSARLRDILVPAAALIELAMAALLCVRMLRGEAALWSAGVCGMGLNLRADGFRALWTTAISFAWVCSSALSPEYLRHGEHQSRYQLFTFLTLGATAGVFLSADLFTTFVFFEVMSLASWVWVAHEDGPAACYAADTYLAVAVIGGLVLLMGLFLLQHIAGTLVIAELGAACAQHSGEPGLYAAGALLLLGFGAKAGMFPLHFWLPMAHPVAPAPASALLSGVLTKCGVFGILVLAAAVFPNDLRWGEAVLGLGMVTMVLGAVLALFSTDLKRTLACSSVSQIGFILVGCALLSLLGEEHGLAAEGVQLHMLNHLLIKTVLFLSAGVFAMNRHTLDLNRLRGAGKGGPAVLRLGFLLGGLSVAGIPLTSGYVSKTLLHEGLAEYIAQAERAAGAVLPQLHLLEGLFLLSGGMTLAYMTRLFYILFLAKPQEQAPPVRMSGLAATGIAAPAAVLLVLGITAHQTMDRLAGAGALLEGLHTPAHAVQYFAWENLEGAAVSITLGVLVYLLLNRWLVRDGALRNVWPRWLDLERRLYRPLVIRALPSVLGCACRILDYALDSVIVLLRMTMLRSVTGNAKRGQRSQYDARQKEWREEFVITSRLIGASLSFGLLLFCIGLTLTLVYLLL